MKKIKNQRKKNRVRYKIKSVNQQKKPRLSVFRAIKNIHAQIIDDQKGCTIVACSTLQKDIKQKIKEENIKNAGNIKAATIVGKKIAKMAREKGVEDIVFDRGNYLYHGRVKALAEAARKEGLKF